MSLLRRWIVGWAGAGCVFWAIGVAHAQGDAAPDPARLRESWEQRVLRRSHEVEPAVAWGSAPAVQFSGATLPAQGATRASALTYEDASVEGSIMESAPSPATQPMPSDASVYDDATVYDEAPMSYGAPGGCAHCAGALGDPIGDPIGDGWAEGVCSDGMCGCDGPACHGGQVWGGVPACDGWLGGFRLRAFSLFAGAHAFKGPIDQGRNGNFGFQEGLNWGIPVGALFDAPHTRVGFQVGLMAVQSNLQGHQVENSVDGEGRDQIFLTAGLFRRAICQEFQWGVVFDMMHDSFYDSTDVKQVRAELSYVISPKWEWGFWGAFGSSRELLRVNNVETLYEPTDQYAFFYRRQFDCGGDGRFWAGFTGDSDVLLGTDFMLPIGRSWALQNSLYFLSPGNGTDVDEQRDESWSLSISLVWYPGQQAACVLRHPFRPLMPVADNGSFLVNEAD